MDYLIALKSKIALFLNKFDSRANFKHIKFGKAFNEERQFQAVHIEHSQIDEILLI
jgi:hypothetical protein